jgi:hypothetical protein
VDEALGHRLALRCHVRLPTMLCPGFSSGITLAGTADAYRICRQAELALQERPKYLMRVPEVGGKAGFLRG